MSSTVKLLLMASRDRQYSLNDNYTLLNFTSYSAILTGGTPHEATFPGPVIKGYKVNTRVFVDGQMMTLNREATSD
jgi:hypothetical protein